MALDDFYFDCAIQLMTGRKTPLAWAVFFYATKKDTVDLRCPFTVVWYY